MTSVNDLIKTLDSPVPAILEASGAGWKATPENGESVRNFRAFLSMHFTNSLTSEIVFATLTEGLSFGTSFYSTSSGYVTVEAVPPAVSDDSVTFNSHIRSNVAVNKYGVFLR